MNRISSRMAAVAASGVAVAGVAATAIAPVATAASTAAHRTTVLNCAGRAQVAPREYTLFCGDGNDTLTKLAWKHWGAKTATATGRDAVDDCTPSCAAGKEKSYPVRVNLSDLTTRHGSSSYRLLTLHFTGRVPSGEKRTESFKLTAHGPEIS